MPGVLMSREKVDTHTQWWPAARRRVRCAHRLRARPAPARRPGAPACGSGEAGRGHLSSGSDWNCETQRFHSGTRLQWLVTAALEAPTARDEGATRWRDRLTHQGRKAPAESSGSCAPQHCTRPGRASRGGSRGQSGCQCPADRRTDMQASFSNEP